MELIFLLKNDKLLLEIKELMKLKLSTGKAELEIIPHVEFMKPGRSGSAMAIPDITRPGSQVSNLTKT